MDLGTVVFVVVVLAMLGVVVVGLSIWHEIERRSEPATIGHVEDLTGASRAGLYDLEREHGGLVQRVRSLEGRLDDVENRLYRLDAENSTTNSGLEELARRVRELESFEPRTPTP